MKVLTIKQPFATLIAEGLKEYEFRTWKTKHRGEFLIHAGKSIDKEALKRCESLNLEYPTGCIIAKVTLEDCIKVDKEFLETLKDKDDRVYHNMIKEDSDWEGYAYKLTNIEKVEPIYINGKLSFWEYNNK